MENIIALLNECSRRRQTRMNNLIRQQRLQNLSNNNLSDLENENEEDTISEASDSSAGNNSIVKNNDEQMMDSEDNEPGDNIYDIVDAFSEQESNNSEFGSSSEEENEDISHFETHLGDVFRNNMALSLNKYKSQAIRKNNFNGSNQITALKKNAELIPNKILCKNIKKVALKQLSVNDSNEATTKVLDDIALAKTNKPRFKLGDLVRTVEILPFKPAPLPGLSDLQKPKLAKKKGSTEISKKRAAVVIDEQTLPLIKQSNKRVAENLDFTISPTPPKKQKITKNSAYAGSMANDAQSNLYYLTNEINTATCPSIPEQLIGNNSTLDNDNPTIRDLYVLLIDVKQSVEKTQSDLSNLKQQVNEMFPLVKQSVAANSMTSNEKPDCLPFKSIDELNQFNNEEKSSELYIHMVSYLTYVGEVNSRTCAKIFYQEAFELSEAVLMQLKYSPGSETNRTASNKINLAKHLFNSVCEDAVARITSKSKNKMMRFEFHKVMKQALLARQQEFRRKLAKSENQYVNDLATGNENHLHAENEDESDNEFEATPQSNKLKDLSNFDEVE